MNNRQKNLLLWIASFITVVIVFQLGYGLKVLIPTNISWLMTVKDDWGQHYLGWFFYRNEPWHFPLGHIDKFYYSLGTNVGFTDSIPLMAIFFKLFAPLLPPDFQYLGLWLFLCYLMAAYYTILLCRLFKLRNFYTYLAMVFVVTNPVLAYRGMHPALCTQWLLIACTYVYFLRPGEVSVNKILRHQFILLMIAVLVNPYIGFMVFGFTFTTAIKICFFNKAISRKKFFGFLGGSVFCILLAWWLVGLIEFGKHEDLGVSGAYGLYAFNLNSLYNAHDFSTILPGFKQVSWHQFESYMYLGVGMMSLLLFLLIYGLYRYFQKRAPAKPAEPSMGRRNRWAVFQLDGNSLVPLAVFVLCVILFAITNRVTFNDKVLFTIPIPPFLTQLGDIFRASARFFWIPYYLILVFAVIALSRLKLKPRDKESILILALFLQLYDIRPILTFRNLTYGGYETPLNDKAWTRLMNQFDDVIFYPPFESHQLTHMDYQYFCFLAARNKKAINIGYVARQDTRGMGVYNDSLSARLEDGQLSPRVLYITTAPYLNEFSVTLQNNPHRLHMLDGYYYILGRDVDDDSLRALSAAEDLKYKAKLDSGLAQAGKKTVFREMANQPPTEGKPIHYYTQRMYNSKTFLSIDGWAFLDTTQNDKGDSIFITLNSAGRSYIAAAAIQSRPDVSAHFSKPYLDDAGFKVIAFFDSVAKGIYQMGIAIKDHQGRFFYQSDKNFIKVGIAEYATPEKTARLPETGKILYGLDYFKTDSGQIRFSGWAAPDGSDAEHSRITGILKSKENSYTFDTEPLSRPDVTTAFHNKLNMDNSGFRAKLQQTALEKGVYQFGILITDTRNNKESMIFTDKTVTIQ